MPDATAGLSTAILYEWRLKAALGAALATLYWTGYFFIERHLCRAPIRFPLMPIDRWIGFSPRWVWGYQSVFLLALLPFLAHTRADIRRYAIGFVAMTLTAFCCFMLFPVLGPRPTLAPTNGLYALLTRCDLPFNNLPSLHMAVATYSACVALRITHGSLRRLFMVLLPAWIILIGYSALATKQHYFVDLPPGILLGWLAQKAAWFWPAQKQKQLPTRRS